MKYLTNNEIKFLKETGFTLTVLQCDEWDRCSVKSFEEATIIADKNYNISLKELVSKLKEGEDSISLEFAAGYLFYTFFTEKQLHKLSDKDGLKFLQDFKYFFGWRKAEYLDARLGIEDALKLYNHTYVFTHQFDDCVWYLDENEQDEDGSVD